MWTSAVVIFFCIKQIQSLSFPSFGNDFKYLVSEMDETAETTLSDSSTVKTSWIEQPLDHFDPKETRTWKMRYFERHDLWKPNKPIYLFLGGEGAASPAFLKTGIMYELAKETNGALFIAEHRYYGQSKPFNNFTTENLKYLSSRQALADFAKLLTTIKSSPEYKFSKVVVVGGSYSGNLAAWIKLHYPSLVDAAIASSAPVLAKADFYEYLEVVSEDFADYGSPGCWDQIERMFSEYEHYFQSDEGIEILKKENNICDSCDMRKKENQELFFSDKASNFMLLAQNGSPKDIKDYCGGTFTSNFWKIDELHLLWNERSECFSYEFNEMITILKDLNYAWIYQTCTEFGYYQTGSSSNQPFTKNIPIEYYYKICQKMFGSDFDGNRVENGVNITNKFYGGLNPKVSNVVFVNGNMDPWSALGVLKDLSNEAPAKVIDQSSHCRDLFSDRASDSEQLKEARKYVKHLIKFWIGEEDYVDFLYGYISPHNE